MTVWITPKAPWHECLTAALPHLMQPWDRSWLLEPQYVPKAISNLGVEKCMLLGPHLLTPAGRRALPKGANVYETENRFAHDPLEIYSERRDIQWWTWSLRQADAMQAAHLPLRVWAYTGPARRAAAVALHYGSLSRRRTELLHAAAARGAVIRIAPPGTFGEALDAQIDAAAAVVNVHYYDQPRVEWCCGLLETFRIVPALSRGATVVSETSCDVETEEALLAAFPGQFFVAPYEQLADKIAEVLRSIERPKGES